MLLPSLLLIATAGLFTGPVTAAVTGSITDPIAGPIAGPFADDEPADVPWAAPELTRVVSVRDGRTDATYAWEAFLDELAKADVVFLGETHNDETTHRVELAVYEGMLARREGSVTLALEMFERDVQALLDAYVAGEVDESTFLMGARPWGNYREAYRPLVERARAAGAPVVASNFPRPLRRTVAMEGAEALADSVDAPRQLLPNTEAYWRRVDNAVRGHLEMMGGGGSPEERLTSTQSLWDNSMGEACALALEAHPGNLVLHVNGGFHSKDWDGTVHQLKLRAPDARVLTVDIVPVPHPAAVELGGAPRADYVVLAEARATDLNDGTRSVYVPREQTYRLHVPTGATDEDPAPLLIWLGDDGLDPEDDLALWKTLLGDEAAIAVLDLPYRETAEDLGPGGRWFWPGSFPEDMGAMHTAVERTWAYVLRHHPIDPDRVCLAGEGTGATVVSAVTLFNDRMDVSAHAQGPRRYAKIKDFPLPLPELRGDDPAPDSSLRVVVASDADREWWQDEVAAYQDIGLETTLVTLDDTADDPWNRERAHENALRNALGLDARPAGDPGQRRHALLDGVSARGRHWARLAAARHVAEHGADVALLDAPPADTTSTELPLQTAPSGDGLPRCPGPFGGTTVVVANATDLEAWRAVAADDPLNARSRFHRLRVATADDLADVLEVLLSERRSNVLIVPSGFCADGDRMRLLRRRVSEAGLDDRMTLHWSPGLGGRPAASH